MIRKLLLPTLILGLLLWAAGCSDNPSNSDISGISQEFGGYTVSAESPAFGDSELADMNDADEEVVDQILASPAVDSLVEDPESGRFHFRAVWGQLEYDSTVAELTDWTGSLTVSRGGLVVRRLIKFEDGQDYYIPRTEPNLVEWVSFTSVHHDGIAVDLFIPSPQPMFDTTVVDDSTITIDTVMPEPVTLTFETGPYSRTFSLAELASLDEVVELDDGNSISFHGIQWYEMVCPRGGLSGQWGFDEEGNGLFRGMWINHRGHLIGWLQGTFETDENGQHVFYGKWIDETGAFEGLLRGTWTPKYPAVAANPNRPNLGKFDGYIYDADGAEIGALRGRYHSARYLAAGWFSGRWKLHCIEPTDDGGDDTVTLSNYDDGF